MPQRDSILTTAEMLDLFSEEIACAGGSVSDSFNDGRRLFARSILPQVESVRAGDNVQGGVALRAFGTDVSVHPYTFRLVCQNGAIRAHSIQSRRLELSGFFGNEDASSSLREAITLCCAPEAFLESINEMRSSQDMQIDAVLSLLPFLKRMGPMATGMLELILDAYTTNEEQTGFGLMNAVTSVARDTRDPEVRWRLEELGGGIPVGRSPRPRRSDGALVGV